MGNTLNIGLGLKSGGVSSGGAGLFAVSGTEASLNQNRWLVPRRYKSGDYLSGASEDFSTSELATIDFDTNIRLEQFVADGTIQPVRYEIMIATQQTETELDAKLQFGLFRANPANGDATLTYLFSEIGSLFPNTTTNTIQKLSGTISETLIAGTICSFGFYNPSGTPATQDIDNLKYWITVYFN